MRKPGLSTLCPPPTADTSPHASPPATSPPGAGAATLPALAGGAPACSPTNRLLAKGNEAIGVRMGGLSEAHPEIAAANITTLVELAGQGKLKPRIWRRFPLEAAADAIQALIDRKVIGKAVLVG